MHDKNNFNHRKSGSIPCGPVLAQDVDPSRQWSSYRGYRSGGVLDSANLPERWDGISGENILWKFKVPGLGLSSPVIWGDQLFITTAVSEQDDQGLKTGMFGNVVSVNDTSEHEWIIYCIDKTSGELIWGRTACKGIPEIKRHPKSSHANTSVATDGRNVVAFFGSEGLYCYDMEGNMIWEKDFGVLRSVFFTTESAEWEFASSPIIHNGIVIIQCDVFENSFVAAFEASTGKEIWKKERDEYPGWNGAVTCYNALTGTEIWTHRAGSGNSYTASPVASDGKLYIVDDKGMVNILKAGPEYIILAENPLGEESMVAPAITDNIIFFRTINYIIAVSGK